MLNFCSCQTARCFNKSKGVLITGLKLKAFRNPQPSWGFSIDKKSRLLKSAFNYLFTYLVPKILSPASPSPGIMYPCSLSP
ncbi:hypothetical protein C4784_25080 [Salmonella enterica subsp. enterica serovar Gaminara]|uniref:Uncharacterized protein n=1 Tax=Salmonella enterica subsp. enterica serovar Gaminara TaxID=913070 RepID=A0A7Z1QJM0_SALET|nr:hypothetical protein C4784_25080 [Salmonella enterica subsp. enterica serovar Gaminara]